MVWLLAVMQFNTVLKSKMAAIMVQPATKSLKTVDELISDGFGIIQEDRGYLITSAKRYIKIRNEYLENNCLKVFFY